MRTNLMRHIHKLANTDMIKLKHRLYDGDQRCSLGFCMDTMVQDYPEKYHMEENRGVTLVDNRWAGSLNLIREYLEISQKENDWIARENNYSNGTMRDMALWITNNILTETERRYMFKEMRPGQARVRTETRPELIADSRTLRVPVRRRAEMEMPVMENPVAAFEIPVTVAVERPATPPVQGTGVIVPVEGETPPHTWRFI